MREIKFRVMCADDVWHFYTLGDFVVRNPIPERLHANTWGQFTGLTDINGVEIYEGDIVRLSFDDGVTDTMTVVYKAPSFQLAGFGVWSLASSSAQIEVIGNIYQNQELLK